MTRISERLSPEYVCIMSFVSTPNRRKHWYHLLFIGQTKLIVICAILGLMVLAVLSTMGRYYYRALQYDLSRVNSGLNTSVLYDADNQLIASLSDKETTSVVHAELPKYLIDAFVAREDENFFEHRGIVFTSVLRSVIRNLMSLRYEQGASTITMQLTRNVFELSGKSMDRKLLEAMLALRIEQRFDKNTIMEQYLSRIYYGQNCYGIRAAARYYFGKPVKELDLVECATLAGLVRAPSLFNPVRSMDKALAVKAETLQRMLECGMISQDVCNEATAAPIVLRRASGVEETGSSYAVMWTRRELEELANEVPEHAGGVAVVSSMILPLQQYVEKSVEAALTAIEKPGIYPEAWLPGDNPEADAAVRTAFARLKRPEGLKARGLNNDLKDLLQCCVLVVDARPGQHGRVLAMVGGRSVVDGRDRWQEKVRPGRAAAPFLFCCACLPGVDAHIVARSTAVTGMHIGYDVVRSFYDKLKMSADLPSREQELYLYNGMYHMVRADLARMLFCLLNNGWGYRLSMINTIWNSNQQPIYHYEPKKSLEYIPRDAASIVTQRAPFHIEEGKPVLMNETLPEGSGQWSLLFAPKAVCVFVWMGFDDATHPLASSKEMRILLSRTSTLLTTEVFEKSRAVLRARAAARKQQQQPKAS